MVYPNGPADAFLVAVGEAGEPADDFLADSGDLSAAGEPVNPDTERRAVAAFARAMAGASGMERVREARRSFVLGRGARQEIMWRAAAGSWVVLAGVNCAWRGDDEQLRRGR